jgi:hypothetical protein
MTQFSQLKVNNLNNSDNLKNQNQNGQVRRSNTLPNKMWNKQFQKQNSIKQQERESIQNHLLYGSEL